MHSQAIWACVAAMELSCALASAQQPIETHHARLMVQQGHSESVTSLAFSPDGRYAVTVGGRSAVLWDLAGGRELVQFNGHADRTEAVAFSPDGRYVLTGSDDHTARLWDAQSGREVRPFVGHLDSVNAVAFSPDGRFVLTGSADWSARLWDVATGKEVQRFADKQGPRPESFKYTPGQDEGDVKAVAFSPDGQQVLTGTNNGAQLWDAASGRLLRQFPQGRPATAPAGHLVNGFPVDQPVTSTGRSVAFSPNGLYVASSSSDDDGGVVQLWDAQSGRKLWSRQLRVGAAGAVSFSSDSQRLLVGGVGAADTPTATVLQVRDAAQLAQLKPGGQFPVAWSPDGQQVLTGGGMDPNGYPALLWDIQRGAIVQRLDARTSGMRFLAASTDGKQLFTLDNGAGVWDLSAGTQTLRFAQRGYRAESPDGRYNLSCLDADGKPGRVATLRDSAGNVKEFGGHAGDINSVGFSPDSRYAFTVSDDLAQVWELSSLRVLYRFPTPWREAPPDRQVPDHGGEAVLSPDGKWVLSYRYSHDLDPKGMVAHLAEAATGKDVRLFQGHTAEIVSMAFSPDSRYALTGSYDTTVRLWDVSTGQELQRFTGGTDLTMAVAFAADPRYILSGSLDGETTIWNRATGAAVVKLFSFRDGGWAVVDSQGHYDASDPDNSGSLYWVTDNRRSIDLGQLEKEYYTPQLLARALQGERLPDVTGMDTVALPPLLAVAQPYDPATKRLQLALTNDGGGVGILLVKVNDRLVATLTPVAPAVGQTATLPIDLSNAPFVACPSAACDNIIRITAYDAANRIESQDAVAHYHPDAAAKGMTTVATDRAAGAPLSAGKFYAIVVGTSTFGDPSLKLTFPAKDAANFAVALRLGAERLYGAPNVSIRVLTSDAASPDGLPTKANIRAAFDYVHRNAKPEDTLVVYLSGHGVMSPSDRDLYYYLTADARTFDVEKDPTLQDVSTVSSTELLSWLREPVATMPGKEVIILDTCAAGGASEALSRLTLKREIPPDQRRAIEMLKDSTGTYILMGAAADAVSYEASKYGEGLLTYALLEGMRDGPFDDGSRLGVAEWFAHASERVPDLAVSIGGIQKPQIAAPRGRGFPVAMLTVDDRGRIPLALPRPQLLRVLVEDDNQDDPLNLRDPLREQLRALNDLQVRGDGAKAPEAPVMYIDASDDDLPGALAPKLLYTVAGGKVSVRIRLVEERKTVAEQTISGSAADPQGLARTLATAIVTMAVGVKP